ncbi:MAG: SurA N-terminal domain-containing protein [Bacillota bacterium]
MFNELRDYSKIVVYIVVIAFIVTGAFMGVGSFLGGGSPGGQQNQSTSESIAVVNGEEISRQQYFDLLQNYAQQTSQFSRTQMLPFRLSVLNSIIEERLLIQEARERDITVEVSEDEIEEVMNNILEQNQLELSELEDILQEQGVTVEDFRQNIRMSLQQQKMVEETIADIHGEVEVTTEAIDERLAQEYTEEELEEMSEEEIEEARSDIEVSIIEEIEEEKFQSWLEEKREEAEIEIKDTALQGIYHYENENYAEARESFSNALEVQNDPAIYIYLAESYSKDGDFESAVEIMEEAMEEHPENWEVAYQYGELHENNDNREEAIEKYELASDYAGDNLMARYQLNLAFSNLGADERASEEMNKFIELQQELQEVQGEESVPPVDEDVDSIEDLDSDEVEPETEAETDNE